MPRGPQGRKRPVDVIDNTAASCGLLPMPDDNDWLRRLMFLGYGDCTGYVVAAIVGMLIFGLYSVFVHH